MKKGFVLLALCLLPLAIFAQDKNDQKNLQEYVIDSFEVDSQWKVEISKDLGIPTLRHIDGSPADKDTQKQTQEEEKDFTDEKVLGLKVNFIKRAFEQILVRPDAPIHIRGVVKNISFFTIGRLYNHSISALFKTYSGQNVIIPVGKMNHYGWKKMEVEVPETIEQVHPNYPITGGMDFVGFLIDLDAMDIRGDYYVYFDDIRIVSDISMETYAKGDDIEDIW